MKIQECTRDKIIMYLIIILSNCLYLSFSIIVLHLIIYIQSKQLISNNF